MSSSSSSSATLPRSITLKRGETAEYVEGRTQGYRVRFDVVEAVCIPAEIFVYRRKPGTLVGSPAVDEFSNVASPADLEEYPVGEPTSNGAFFRLHYVDLIHRSLDLLEQSAQDIISDVSALVDSLDQLDALTEHYTTITGSECLVDLTAPVVKVVVSSSAPTVNDDITQNYANGSWWVDTTTGIIYVLINNAAGNAQWVITALIVVALTSANKEMPALVTTADGDLATVTPLVVTPSNDGYVMVDVNGHGASVGDGVKSKDCYFSNDGGTTALLIRRLQAGATLHWNGSIAGYQLAIDDRVTFNYIA